MPRKLTPRQKAGRLNRAKRKGLTPEGREALRLAALANRPWEHSTGPRTEAGKKASRENALKHGGRAFDTLPPVALAAIEAIQAAERHGVVPDAYMVYHGLRVLMNGPMPAFFRGCDLMLRYQRLARKLAL